MRRRNLFGYSSGQAKGRKYRAPGLVQSKKQKRIRKMIRKARLYRPGALKGGVPTFNPRRSKNLFGFGGSSRPKIPKWAVKKVKELGRAGELDEFNHWRSYRPDEEQRELERIYYAAYRGKNPRKGTMSKKRKRRKKRNRRPRKGVMPPALRKYWAKKRRQKNKRRKQRNRRRGRRNPPRTVMRRYRRGTLRSSSGRTVTSPTQARAILLSELRRAGYDVAPKPNRRRRKSRNRKRRNQTATEMTLRIPGTVTPQQQRTLGRFLARQTGRRVVFNPKRRR